MKASPKVFNSLSQLHQAMGQPAPLHPLISLINYGEAIFNPKEFEAGIILNFYKISFKTNFKGQLKYGQGFYDFEAGGMSFIAPGQILRMQDEEANYEGMSLHVHPDFIRNYVLNNNIKQYGFFGYIAAEALYLSDQEREIILNLFSSINGELHQRIDHFSQDVMISQLELLLNYSNRFYNRQFITRKAVNHHVLDKLEAFLDHYFNGEKPLTKGLPTVASVADELNLSPRYLSDLLRNLTGQNTQQFIHDKLIESAKAHLAKDILTIAEIAYHLGFEHPQSFTKLFKHKTNITPLQYKNDLQN